MTSERTIRWLRNRSAACPSAGQTTTGQEQPPAVWAQLLGTPVLHIVNFDTVAAAGAVRGRSRVPHHDEGRTGARVVAPYSKKTFAGQPARATLVV